MSTQENIIESLIELLNSHFDMELSLDENNFPVVTQATGKGSLDEYINDFLKIIDSHDLDGKINYYFGNELDFDTPEEFHRH